MCLIQWEITITRKISYERKNNKNKTKNGSKIKFEIKVSRKKREASLFDIDT